jgi:hypothetical protein
MPEVTFNVPDDSKDDLLAIWPNTQLDENDDLIYTDWAWIRKKFVGNFNNIRHNGKEKRARLAVTRTDTIA